MEKRNAVVDAPGGKTGASDRPDTGIFDDMVEFAADAMSVHRPVQSAEKRRHNSV